MTQAQFTEYILSTEMPNAQQLAELSALREQYPASSAVAFLYARALRQLDAERYEKEKKKLLLAIVSRPLLMQYAFPIEEYSAPQTEKIEPADSTPAEIERVEEPEFIDELIDKFTNNAPKIKCEPEKPEAAVNYGKTSCVENPEIVSETLAVIFAQQGYYGKAMKIYKKLCLQNPEKSSYFAAQISKLKEERNINNKNE